MALNYKMTVERYPTQMAWLWIQYLMVTNGVNLASLGGLPGLKSADGNPSQDVVQHTCVNKKKKKKKRKKVLAECA